MGLTDNHLLQVYQKMHKTFPEDLHVARPLIQMLQSKGDVIHARNLAMSMARRMLAKGHPGDAISFLEICKLLKHPDREEIEAIGSMARITSNGPIDIGGGDGRTFMLVDQLSDLETRDFLSHGHLINIEAGHDIVRQSEVNRSFYLILEGKMQVHMITKDDHRIDLNRLGAGHFFGEFACVYQLPRSATVTAIEKSLVLEFSDLSVSQLMQRSPIAGERLMKIVQGRLIQSMSYSHPAMSELPETDRKWLAEESHLLEFQSDSLITRAGEMSDRCCIIIYGTATATHTLNGKTVELHMESGEMFGDLNPYLKLPSNTAVRTDGRCLVCCMPKKVFRSFMNAYGHFEQWVETHGKERLKKLNSKPS